MLTKRTIRACNFIKWLSLFLMVSIPVIITAYWISPGDIAFVSDHFVNEFSDPAALGIGQKFAGYLVSIIPVGILCAGLWQISRLAVALKAGKFFDPVTISRLHITGVIFIVFTIANVIHRTLLSIILTYDNPPGHRMLAIELEFSDAGYLLFGALFLVLISVFAEGQKQRDDLSEIV